MGRPLLFSLLRILLAVSVIAGAVHWLFIRDATYTATESLRAGHGWPPSSVKIAVPWSQDGRMSLIQGVQLALEELNKGDSPLAGRIEVDFIDEPPSTMSDGRVARRIVKDAEVVAVIGHEESDDAMLAAITYEASGILYLSPKTTLTRLTAAGLRYTLRLVPDDDVFAEALVNFAIDRSWKRIGVIYGRFEQGEALARAFYQKAVTAGLDVAYHRSYLPEQDPEAHEFRPLLASIVTDPTDAILLADQMPWAGNMLDAMQDMGIKQPILAGDKLDSSAVAKTGAKELYVASAVDPDSSNPEFMAFRKRFRERFGKSPGYGSSQGYEAFTLFVKAAERAHSVDPIVLSTTLKSNKWNGLFGRFAFQDNGAMVGRTVLIKQMIEGKFRVVDLVQYWLPQE